MLLRYVFFLLILTVSPLAALAQNAGAVRGQVLDPSGAIVPGASLTLSTGKNVYTNKSDQHGS
jgi:hypothetical protein